MEWVHTQTDHKTTNATPHTLVAMLYKFKSPAAGNLIMLEPNGRQILKILGKDDPAQLIKGIVLPQDMPAAIKALHAVSLRQRALPFIDMLQRAHQAGKEIVWGV